MQNLSLAIALSFFSLAAFCQERLTKGFVAYVDLGVDKSIGKDKTESKPAVLNPNASIQYFSWQQFENPSVRFRASVLYPFSRSVSLGIQSGVTARYQTLYTDAQRFWISVPMQLRAVSQLAKMDNGSLFFDVAAGLNIQNREVDRHTEKTGVLISLGLMATKKNWFLRFGYEYQKDKGVWHIAAYPLRNIVEEFVDYNTRHSLLYLSLGKRLFEKN